MNRPWRRRLGRGRRHLIGRTGRQGRRGIGRTGGQEAADRTGGALGQPRGQAADDSTGHRGLAQAGPGELAGLRRRDGIRHGITGRTGQRTARRRPGHRPDTAGRDPQRRITPGEHRHRYHAWLAAAGIKAFVFDAHGRRRRRTWDRAWPAGWWWGRVSDLPLPAALVAGHQGEASAPGRRRDRSLSLVSPCSASVTQASRRVNKISIAPEPESRSGALKYGTHLHTPSGRSATVVGGYTPRVATGWMWDLTVTANHDFYVQVVRATILVHNVESCDIDQLKAYARQIRLAGDDPQAVNERVMAVGQDEAGNLTAGSSNSFDRGQRLMADQLKIRRVPSRAGYHAEEDLIADNEGSLWPLKRVASDNQVPCGPERNDCAGQLDRLGIEHN